MKLYLTQHGEASDKNQNPERPLTANGRQDIRHMASFLRRTELQVQRVIHSGKLRARETAELLGNAVAGSVAIEILNTINPNDEPGELIANLEQRGEDSLIVGHLPFMAKLVSHLVTMEHSNTLVSYQPGTIVCLENNDNGDWVINWMIRPELLGSD